MCQHLAKPMLWQHLAWSAYSIEAAVSSCQIRKVTKACDELSLCNLITPGVSKLFDLRAEFATAWPLAVVYVEYFHGDGLVQGHMVVICIWCSLFVTSFPCFQTNVLAKFLDIIMHIFLHPLPLFYVALH